MILEEKAAFDVAWLGSLVVSLLLPCTDKPDMESRSLWRLFSYLVLPYCYCYAWSVSGLRTEWEFRELRPDIKARGVRTGSKSRGNGTLMFMDAYIQWNKNHCSMRSDGREKYENSIWYDASIEMWNGWKLIVGLLIGNNQVISFCTEKEGAGV